MPGRPFMARAAVRLAPAIVGLACLGATALPAQAAEPWGFEQVTPVDKGAGAVHPIDTFQPTADGNGLLLTATSEFAAVPAGSVPLYTRYFASRGADGWSLRSLDPPTGPAKPNNIATVMATLSASSDASHVAVASTLPLTPDSPAGEGSLYIRSTATGEYTRVASSADSNFIKQFFANQGNTSVRWVAPDGRSALFSSIVPLVPGAPDGRGDGGVTAGLYSWTAEAGVRIVSVLPDSEGGGMTPTGWTVGGEFDYGIRNPIPDSGGLEHVYFSAYDGAAYAHTAGETRAVSVSRVPDASSEPVRADVKATGRNGRFMLFFVAGSTPLTSDTPSQEEIGAQRHYYRYDASDDSLTYIGPAMGQLSPVQMSQDGRTVGFFSPFQLAPGAPSYDPETRQESLYVWRDGVTRFVAQVDPTSIPATRMGQSMRVLSSNGRYLAYTDNSTGPSSGAARTGADLGGPNPACQRELGGGAWEPEVCAQVFVYDADADELQCASCRTDGLAPKGPSGDPTSGAGAGRIRMDHRQMQTVADDGTTFFTTGEALVEEDLNGLNDAYAFRDGEHRLLSRATEKAPARFLDATPDGKSVFIATNDQIAPTDDDKAVDIYMTREGAGFPFAPPIVDAPCEGGECRAPFALPTALPLAGSVAFSGSGNVRPAGALSVSGGKSIVGTAAKLRVRVPGKGRVTVSGAGVKTARQSVARAGTYTVRVVLTAKARKVLKRSKSARKRVRVTFTPAEGSASKRTLSLTYKAKPNSKKKGR